MNTQFGILALAVLSLAACNKEQAPALESGERQITITASREDAGTRTVLQSDGKSIWWSAPDKIDLFYGPGTTPAVFTSQNNEPAATATFTGNLEVSSGQSYYGIYPSSSSSAVAENGEISVLLPATQQGLAGTFSPDVFPCVAVSETSTLNFRNVAGGIKFSVGDEGVTEVVFHANGSEPLAGIATVAFEDGIPVFKGTSSPAVTDVTITAPEGGFVKDASYYAVLLPGKLASGITITLKKGSEASEIVSDKAQEVKRGVFGNVGELTAPSDKQLTVERLWSKFGTAEGPWHRYFTTTSNCGRSIAMDDDYIFMPEAQENPVLWKIPIDGTTAPSTVPVGTVDGGGTFSLCCARIIPNVKEAVNSGKDYVLAMTNLSLNQNTYFYYYRYGIDNNPEKVLIRTSGTNRRLGDKFTWNGTINEGKIWLNDAYDNNDQGAVITAYMKWTTIQEDGWPARITLFKEGPSESGIVGAGYAYPDYTDPLNVTSNVLYTSPYNACLVNDIGTNTSTVDEFSGNGWYKNAAGFQFFEFEGKKYIAYAKMETTTQSRLIIIEDLGSGAQFKETLHNHNVVYQAPIQHESNFDEESPCPSVHGCVDCSVRIINGEPYIAVLHQNVGLSLFKMSMK